MSASSNNNNGDSGSGNESRTISAIQKAKNKRTVLPKTSLIQLYLNTSKKGSSDDMICNTTRTSLLPKFNQQDIFNQLKNSSLMMSAAQPTKKIIKEALNSNRRPSASVGNKNDSGKALCDNSSLNIPFDENRSSRENLIKHLTKEFLLDCKQKLDSVSFKKLLSILAESNKSSQLTNSSDRDKEHRRLLDEVYEIIRNHRFLCNKFAAFLTPEHALRYDVFAQTLHYERCYEFFDKLEQTVANKCALKKLLQLMANAPSTIAEEPGAEKMGVKLDEMRAKLKTVTRNNHSLMNEFERLFNQRMIVDEPVYEAISLVDSNNIDAPIVDGQVVELVDLTDSAFIFPTTAATKQRVGGKISRSANIPPSSSSSSASASVAVTTVNKTSSKVSTKKL